MLIRTIEQAYRQIKEKDPDTAISKNYVRTLVKNGEIPSTKAGTKFLIDVEVLEAYISKRTA